MRSLGLALVLAMAVTAAPRALAQAPAAALEPVDQAGEDAAFAAFLEQLRRDVAERDLGGVLRAASPDIRLSFGDLGGRGDLALLLTDPADGPGYWAELERALSYGAARTRGGLFCTPYVACIDLELGFDPMDAAFILDEDVPVHAAPDPGSAVMARLSHAAVPIESHEDPEWVGIVLPDGGTGYVARPGFRTVYDYRAFFGRADGGWEMQMFLAGD